MDSSCARMQLMGSENAAATLLFSIPVPRIASAATKIASGPRSFIPPYYTTAREAAVTASHIPWAPARALLDSGSAFRSTVLLSPFAAHRAFLAASRNRGCSVDGCAASFPGSLRPHCRPSGYRPRFYRRLLPFLLAAPVVRDSWPSTPCSPLARQDCE